MPTDIFQENGSPNTYGPVVYTGYKTYASNPNENIPEPDITGLNTVYQNRFTAVNGLEYSMDRKTSEEYFSTTASTGVVGELNSLDFDEAGTEEVIFTSMASSNYGRRPLDILVEWAIETTGTGSVVWGAQIKPYTLEAEITGADYGTMVSGTFEIGEVGVVSESRIYMSYESMENLRKSDLYSVRIKRMGSSSEDTYASDAALLAIELIESSSAG